MSIAFNAMLFARRVHAGQQRKYTGTPYADHLAEVAGIVAAAVPSGIDLGTAISVAWLHDCMEDQGVTYAALVREFGHKIADGVCLLSDTEVGNRAERKAAARLRLANATGWVQSIKCADLISNTSSILMHDPKFAEVYLAEKAALLDVMRGADPRLIAMASLQVDRQLDPALANKLRRAGTTDWSAA